jgi:hypothetical protein
MANKIFSAISMLLAAAILTPTERASAQTAFSAPGDSVVERRCSSVVLASASPLLPLRLIRPYLERQEDFKASRLVLTDAPESADATVTLSQSGEHGCTPCFTASAEPQALDAAPWRPLPWIRQVISTARTNCDGAYGYGNVFELVQSNGSWTYKDLYDFTGGSDGGNPISNVIFDANGNLYGTASAGGNMSGPCAPNGCGVVWEITP